MYQTSRYGMVVILPLSEFVHFNALCREPLLHKLQPLLFLKRYDNAESFGPYGGFF